jgi:DNA-binding NarL/FixJ family response regulator
MGQASPGDGYRAGQHADLGVARAMPLYARRGASMSSETIRVFLADDHAMVREGLRLLLRAAQDIAIIGEAADGATTVAFAQRFAPHVVVLDLEMPGGDGVLALRELQRTAPQVRVLILTMHAEQKHLVQLLETGARGYLTKDAASRDLVEAIRVVAGGEVYVRPTAARMLASAVVPQHTAETARGRFKALSDREQTILRMVAQGYSGVEIARELRISTKTVDAYKHRIEDKLGLAHRTHYVRFGIEAGILSGQESCVATADTAPRHRRGDG